MRVPLFYVELTEKSRTNMKQESQTTASRPFAALLLVTGLVALFVLGYRLLANRSKAAPDALELRQPPPRSLDRSMDMPRAKRLLRLAIIHPFITSVMVVALAVLLTLAYLQIASSADAEVLARQPPSEYDEHFNYGQMQSMWHFAMCDAMLFSTKPEDEIEKVKERIAVAVEYTGPSGTSHPDAYKPRIRSASEIAETIRLASEFYERVNCK